MRASETVVLVHGYGAGGRSFSKLSADLAAAGLRAVVFEYDDGDWERIACEIAALAETLAADAGAARISFVGHSLGCLLIRKALSAVRGRFELGHLVMLAPPTKGSKLFRALARMMHALTAGLAGMRVMSGNPAESIPPPSRPFAVIAGGTGGRLGFNPLLGGDNDGVLLVEETWDAAAAEFHLVRATHWRLPAHRDARAATLRFLRSTDDASR